MNFSSRGSPTLSISPPAIIFFLGILYTLTLTFSWIRQLGSIFQERGITLLHHQILDVENDIAYAWTTMNMNGMKELVIAAGGSREAIELHRRAAKDVQRGACITMSLLNVVGRKAGGG